MMRGQLGFGSSRWILSKSNKLRKLLVLLLTMNRRSRLTLHPAEMFPFIISTVVVVQGATFIGIQSSTLKEVISIDCRATAQVVWPGIVLLATMPLVRVSL